MEIREMDKWRRIREMGRGERNWEFEKLDKWGVGKIREMGKRRNRERGWEVEKIDKMGKLEQIENVEKWRKKASRDYPQSGPF